MPAWSALASGSSPMSRVTRRRTSRRQDRRRDHCAELQLSPIDVHRPRRRNRGTGVARRAAAAPGRPGGRRRPGGEARPGPARRTWRSAPSTASWVGAPSASRAGEPRIQPRSRPASAPRPPTAMVELAASTALCTWYARACSRLAVSHPAVSGSSNHAVVAAVTIRASSPGCRRGRRAPRGGPTRCDSARAGLEQGANDEIDHRASLRRQALAGANVARRDVRG